MVFRKDYDSHKENVNELLDACLLYTSLALDEMLESGAIQPGQTVACVGSVSYTHLDVYKRQTQEAERLRLLDLADRCRSLDELKDCLRAMLKGVV